MGAPDKVFVKHGRPCTITSRQHIMWSIIGTAMFLAWFTLIS
mgnify:CR=1 FL=1